MSALLAYTKERNGNGDTVNAPHFRCATCGRPITDPEAIVTQPEKYNGDMTGSVAVYHRGSCDPGHSVAWDHLGDFLTYLVFNSGVSAETLRGLLAAVEKREAEAA